MNEPTGTGDMRHPTTMNTHQEPQTRLAPPPPELKGLNALAAFGAEVLKKTKARMSQGWPGEEDEANLVIALQYGLVQRVSYDVIKHGEMNGDYELGDTIWWWGREFSADSAA